VHTNQPITKLPTPKAQQPTNDIILGGFVAMILCVAPGGFHHRVDCGADMVQIFLQLKNKKR